MEEIKCIFCNKSSDNVIIEENGFKGRKCPECNLIFISPRPNQKEILNIYNKNITYAKSHISNDYASRLVARNNLEIIKKFKRSGTLLEMGAGSGYFLDEAKKAGFDVCGIELNKYEAKFINNTLGIPCESSPLSDSSFGDKKFDIIYHRDVLSHLYDPISVFSIINRKLNDNGLVVFETGNLGDADLKYLKYFNYFEYPGHLFFLSRESLNKLLIRTGFELQGLFTYSLIPKLLFRKLADPISNRAKDKASADNGSIKSQSSDIASHESGLFNIAKRVYLFMDYFACYKIGKIAPKERRPQTCIIVARKCKCQTIS